MLTQFSASITHEQGGLMMDIFFRMKQLLLFSPPPLFSMCRESDGTDLSISL